MGRRSTAYEPSPAGLVLDVEEEMLRMCQEGFHDQDELKFLEGPKNFKTINPQEDENLDIPSLYVWNNGFSVEGIGLGAGTGKKTGREIELFCNIQYITPSVTDVDSSKELKKIGWHLFNWVDANQELGDIVNTWTSDVEVDFFPQITLVGDSVTKISNVNLKISYTYRDNKSRTQR
jgi:hypothetical protein